MIDRNHLGHWVRRFLMEYATCERNLSPNTCVSYRDMLILLLPFVARRKRVAVDEIAVTDLSADVVRAFLTHIERDRECVTATRNQRLASIQALARFISEHSPEHVEWAAQVRLVPIKKGVGAGVPYLEKPEIDALLAAPDSSTPQGARDHALLLFLYNTGARVSEATTLRIGDVDWQTKSVQIMGKGRKQRRCPLWAETIGHLRRLAGERPDDACLFVNRRGEPYTRYGVHALVERYVTKLRTVMPALRAKRISPVSTSTRSGPGSGTRRGRSAPCASRGGSPSATVCSVAHTVAYAEFRIMRSCGAGTAVYVACRPGFCLHNQEDFSIAMSASGTVKRPDRRLGGTIAESALSFSDGSTRR
jgi:integrase/recombinase XerD